MVWGKREDSWWNSEYVDSVILGLLKKLIESAKIGGCPYYTRFDGIIET